MTELEKELNDFLTNQLNLDNGYKTIETYNVSPSTKFYIGGFYERLSIDQFIKIENFLKQKLNVEKIYIEVCEIDSGYAISWD